MDKLPRELIEIVCDYLQPKEYGNLRKSSKSLFAKSSNKEELIMKRRAQELKLSPLAWAIKQNRMDLFNSWLKEETPIEQDLSMTAIMGNLEAFNILAPILVNTTNNTMIGKNLMNIAINNERINIVNKLLNQKYVMNESEIEKCVNTGNVQLIESLQRKGVNIKRRYFLNCCHPPVIRRFLTMPSSIKLENFKLRNCTKWGAFLEIGFWATFHGKLNILQELPKGSLSKTTFDLAAACGHLHIVVYLQSIGVFGTQLAVIRAGKYHHKNVIEYMMKS